MRFVRRVVAVALVAPVLLVPSCSDDEPKPKFEDSPSVTPTPTPTQTSEPEAWEEKSEDGADAFVVRWFDELTAASNSGSTAAFAGLGTPRCETCTSIADYIDEVYGEGGSIAVRPWRVLEVGGIPDGSTLNRPSIPVRVAKPREVVHRTKPDETFRIPAERYIMNVDLLWTDGRWFVANADRLD